jgi:hypothetical protein
MNTPLAKIIRPIVEGGVKTWMVAHPDGERYPGHLITGIGKRVTHTICSAQTVERIKLALGRDTASVLCEMADAEPHYRVCQSAGQLGDSAGRPAGESATPAGSFEGYA